MSIKQDKARGEEIAPDVRKDIEGTPIADSGVQSDALARPILIKMPPQKPAEILVAAGHDGPACPVSGEEQPYSEASRDRRF